MSYLANALRQITKKSSNPNTLIYQLQLERAKQKYLVQEQLGDGTEAAVALGAPESKNGENDAKQKLGALDREQQSHSEAAEGNNEGIQSREADGERARAHGDDDAGGGGKEG
ncbi:hypothetical protein V495_01385 [Pseudogymnoascus sp. VKM F-4514 (FW-929)]|nr:hypothetical protein V490_04288 [Pseudogymnoascus sp. VKM F-3557]KFY48389.1 hypothetical protein V495_01385 [Pseudogymnoascus sp. VKM F-4514 (FW-929)]KFY51904.1 hypothetical protein V497_08767 [Pseudogymnoascus sp. VKM F-4516 (FW-969)]